MCVSGDVAEIPVAPFSRTILVVEDHAAAAKLVSDLIKEAFPSCRVLLAATAENALAICESNAPDVVIMDISLPGMNGIDATRRIKLLYPLARVVMHSNNDMQVFREAAANAGAAAFVSKMDTLAELVSAMEKLLLFPR